VNFHEVLRLPSGTLISGTVRIPCQIRECQSIITIEIDDVDKDGHGGEIDGIDSQCEATEFCCDDCRPSYLRDCAMYESQTS